MNTLILVLLSIFTTAGNNVYGQVMASRNSMHGYPSFLLYGTTFFYCIGFWAMARAAGENVWQFTRAEMRQYLLLGLWTSLNGICFQFADPWIDGPTQQLIVSVMPVFVLAASRLMLPSLHITRREWIGSGVVFAGVALGLVPTAKLTTSAWFWVVLFIASVGFQAVEVVQQELAFARGCRARSTLFWYNVVSLVAYVLIIPFESVKFLNGHDYSLSFQAAFTHQWEAIRCFFGAPTAASLVSGDCGSRNFAWAAPMLFVAFYIGMFFTQALVIKHINAFASIMIQAAGPPLASAAFSAPALVGRVNAAEFSPWSAGAFALIAVGLVVKGVPARSDGAVSFSEDSTQTDSLIHHEAGVIHREVQVIPHESGIQFEARERLGSPLGRYVQW